MRNGRCSFPIPLLLIGAALSGAPSYAQKATEKYIPIGASPGLSGTHTIIGRIEAIDAGAGTITVVGSEQTWTASVTERTRVWLDRSRLRQATLRTSLGELREGLLVEVKYEAVKYDATGRSGSGAAEWIKCQAPGPH